MKIITVIFVLIIGLVYCVVATLPTKQLNSVCETTLDWLRTDENALTYMKNDEEVSSEFIQLLESDKSSENICDLLALHDTGNDFFLGGLVKAVGAIIKVAKGASRVAKAAHKGAKIAHHIQDHHDRHKHRHRHRKPKRKHAQLF